MMGWRVTWVLIKQAFSEKKKIKVIFADDSEGEFRVVHFDDSSGVPVWITVPDAGPGRNFTEAKSIEIIEKE